MSSMASRGTVWRGLWAGSRRYPTMTIGIGILAAMVLVALAAPALTADPLRMQPNLRLQPPSAGFWFGTDHLGRDVFARTLHGARVSLAVGLSVATLAVLAGTLLGLVAGYFRRCDAVIIRIMDGLMAIPAILLAIALAALAKASLTVLILAIVVPEIPRMARLVRSVTLVTRNQQYVEAAVACGTPTWKILLRHILPSTIAPVIVQATYVCASAILVESALSFLGAGTPPELASWGNMIASGRLYFARAPWTIFCPGVALALVVLAINLLGDGLRDRLDPRLAGRI